MRPIDRASLFVAYVMLVGVVAWSAWSTSVALDRIEEDVCAAAEISVAGQLLNIATYGQQEGVNAQAAVATIETLIIIVDKIQERCGDIFLDDVEIPDITLDPLPLDD